MMWVSVLIAVVPLGLLGIWLNAGAEGGFIPWQVVTLFASSYLAGGGFMLLGCLFWAWVVRLRTSVLGTARFAGLREARKRGLLESRGVILGKKDGKLLRFDDAGHILTISRTRGGKGVSAVIPNLLAHEGSIFCIDIKGENYAITAEERRGFGAVHPIAPFAGFSACLNPLDFIRQNTGEIDDCELVATLIVTPSSGDDAFWEREARTLISSLIQFVMRHRDKEAKTLAEVRKLLTLPASDFDELLAEMAVSKHAWIRRNANAFSQKADKERSGVISTAQSHTRFLDSPNIQRVTAQSDFKFTDMKHQMTSVYLIMPPHQVTVYRQFMRLMVGLAQASMTRTHHHLADPVLFMLDEFPSLGKMPIAGFAYLAGYQVRLWVFSQSMSQLEAVYGKAAGMILSNCAVQQIWSVAPSDIATAEHLSRTLGDKTVRSYSHSKSATSKLPLTSKSFSESEGRLTRRLLTPDEILCLPETLMILMIAGARPFLATRFIYYKDKLFAGRYGEWLGTYGGEHDTT